jgi:sortase A
MTDLPSDATTSTPSTSFRDTVLRTVRTLGWTAIGVGLFLLGFVGHQLFVTTWFAQQNNAQLSAEAEGYFSLALPQVQITEITPLGTPGSSTSDPEDPTIDVPSTTVPADDATATRSTLLVEPTPPDHEPFAIIRIPTIERLSTGWAVVRGVSVRDLRNGAGHMPKTPLPGQPGNSVISGHRTTYGAPFHELDELVPGDRIEVETAIGIHVYEVRETLIVRPTEVWVADDRPGAWLTLTTCHPKFSSRQRLVVFAELVDGPNARAIFGP